MLRPLRTALAEIGPRLDALEDVAGQTHDLPDELARVPAKILELEQRLQKPGPSLEELAALALRIRGIEERPYAPASLSTDLAAITARLNALEQQAEDLKVALRESSPRSPPESRIWNDRWTWVSAWSRRSPRSRSG